MTIIITGITGFVGPYLTAHIREQNPSARIVGVGKASHFSFSGGVYERCDLVDKAAVFRLVKQYRPDMIFHLAAQSSVYASWEDAEGTLMNNIRSAVHILEAVREYMSQEYRPRVLFVGSSEQYGSISEENLPLRENDLMRPASPYAVSKVAQDHLGLQYFLSYGVPVVRVRAFNHSGPGRSQEYVDSNFARQIALIEHGKQDPVIEVGNTGAVRDFSDVRDIVRAYWFALQKGIPGEVYNVCSGNQYVIQEILEELLSLSRISHIRVYQDPARMRPSDNPILYGTADKLRRETGWKPHYSYMHDTLPSLLSYWREKVSMDDI